ncbi:MAG: transcriptional repressor [Clostridiales bacterium]|nr:transcriptional repressor [Clostridiales bacterium]
MQNYAQLTEELKARSIKPSLQRLLLLNYMHTCHTHPTVEQIYADLAAQGHALSKATVYNTLTLFVQKGLLRVVNLDRSEARYDVLACDHGHFVCECCGAIYDEPIDFDKLNLIFPEAGSVNQRDLFYRGVCKRCLSKE